MIHVSPQRERPEDLPLLTPRPAARRAGGGILRLAALVGALAVVAACASLTPPSDRTILLKRIVPSTVQLRAEREGGGRRSGSGVVIASDTKRSWIVTTRHLLEPVVPQQLWVSGASTRSRVKAVIAAVSDDADLALIEAQGLTLPAVTLKDRVSLGDEVWVVSFPWGRRLTVVSGIVSQIAAEEGEAPMPMAGPVRMVDAAANYGTSGGGIFEAATGNLIGIVEGYRTARVTLRTMPEQTMDIPVAGETTVLSASAIRRFLRANRLEPPVTD